MSKVKAPRGAALQTLSGVGPQLAKKLSRIGVHRVQDLLFHLPLRYQDRSRLVALGSARTGAHIMVVGQIDLSSVTFGRRRSLLIRISDGTGPLTVRLFHFSATQRAALRQGRWLQCFGEVRPGPATLEMVHPEYSVFDDRPPLPDVATLTPIYPTTEGVGQRLLRRLLAQALASPDCLPADWLPDSVRRELGFAALPDALAYVHNPPVDADQVALECGQHRTQQRLAFDELLAHHLALRRLKQRRLTHNAPTIATNGGLLKRLLGTLGFTLTAAQQRVIAEVVADLQVPTPTLRLIQGDVGAGKTVVAAAAAVCAVEGGYQVALMAPTELLAEQHLRSFYAWLEPLNVDVVALTGALRAGARREVLAQIANGTASVVVGTHALFQVGVEFERLGLIIVDEQHRFGVGQRLALRNKGRAATMSPHQITMTATPIPRSLAMTFYADLDVSSIDELPPGRQPVETVVLPETRRADVLHRVSEACRAGRQAYWVCPLIDESDVLEVQAATDTSAALVDALPNLHVGLVHGRLSAAQKDAIMQRFRDGDIDVLVATTVIEVGVDVANASLMIIENAERLGLAQLHQLRGRVGRGSTQSCCVLMYRAPLSGHARRRLAVLRDTNDGFEIARHDLEQRGPGEVLGTRQTGLQQLRIADLVRDRALLPQIEAAATEMLARHPHRVEWLIARWISDSENYGNV